MHRLEDVILREDRRAGHHGQAFLEAVDVPPEHRAVSRESTNKKGALPAYHNTDLADEQQRCDDDGIKDGWNTELKHCGQANSLHPFGRQTEHPAKTHG